MAYKVLTHTSFMRYIKANQTFEYKITETAAGMVIKEAEIGPLIDRMKKGPQGAEMAKVFATLVDASRKDPEGKWNSVSDAPIKAGQAVV